jgi:hypothetical protein
VRTRVARGPREQAEQAYDSLQRREASLNSQLHADCPAREGCQCLMAHQQSLHELPQPLPCKGATPDRVLHPVWMAGAMPVCQAPRSSEDWDHVQGCHVIPMQSKSCKPPAAMTVQVYAASRLVQGKGSGAPPIASSTYQRIVLGGET